MLNIFSNFILQQLGRGGRASLGANFSFNILAMLKVAGWNPGQSEFYVKSIFWNG